MMSRRHYVELAKILGANDVAPMDRIVVDLVAWLRADNPRFDSQRFREAVGDAYVPVSSDRGSMR
jgi:hypothetical protein